MSVFRHVTLSLSFQPPWRATTRTSTAVSTVALVLDANYLHPTDIYGDDEVEIVTADQQEDHDEQEQEPSPSSSSLPPKPTNDSLSYSAQIAQQFSQYQQTPGQERQPRQSSSAGAPIPTHESNNAAQARLPSDSIFGKKPSEMHDEG